MTDSQVEVCACGYGSCEGNCAVYELGSYLCQKATNLCDGLEVARVKIYERLDGRYSVQVYDSSDYTCVKAKIREFVTACDVCDYSLNAKIRCKGSGDGDEDSIIMSKKNEFMPAILYIVITAAVTLVVTAVVATIIYVIINIVRQKKIAQYARLNARLKQTI